MSRGVTLLFVWAILKVACSEKKYILPALGLGGKAEDTGVKITLVISNPGTDTVQPTATLIQNNTDILSTSCPVVREAVKFEDMKNFQEDTLLNRSELANKSIEVVASEYDFNLHVVYERNGYNEGYVALSTSDIGNEYYVSTFCALGGYCQIAVATVQSDVTRVYFKLPAEVDEIVICVGERYWRSKYHTSFNLTYPETLQIETTHDLTGTFIYSDKPISVIAGTRSMPAQGSSLLHFMEQLVPVSQWGTEFVVRGFETAYGCVIHITSSEQKTVVQMTGFKTVEMSGSGQTLKRRLEETTVSYIKSSKPVQVIVYVGITYGSYDAIYSVGMTTIPAKEHFQTSYVYNSNGQNTFFQYVIGNGETVDHHPNAIITQVPYTHYQVNTLNLTSTSDSNKLISTSSSLGFGGIFMLDTAVFPMAPTITTATAGCVADAAKMSVGDGVDNDCDGSVDEDYCFENAKITSTFIPGVTDKIPAYTAKVTDFYELLFRVQSCDTVQVELKDSGINTGKIVIHISWAHIIIYKCFPNCDNVQTLNTTNMLSNINCSSDVISYWVMQTSNSFCIGIGRRNLVGSCSGIISETSLTSELVDLKLSGLMRNATIWYDMYRTDCGKFSSDWRCQDAVTNCFEYEDDLCTNPSYSQWVDQNCRQFCGTCSPDNFGRMFVYYPAPWTSVGYIQYLKIVGYNQGLSRVGVETGSEFVTAFDKMVEDRQQTGISVSSFQVSDVTDPIFIFTEEDSAIYFSFEWNSVNSKLLQPLDAIGNEYMTIAFGLSDLYCYAVALEPGTSSDVFTGSQILSHQNYVSFSETLSTNQTGTLITGNKPFAMFCGTDENSEYGLSWFQVPATKTWGTHYITPALGTTGNSGKRAKIKIVANSNNTVIEVHGDFDGIYVLMARGDSKELETDAFETYDISTNFPVGVAIMFYDGSTSNNKASFHVLPPVEAFMDNPVILGYSDFSDNVTSLTETTRLGNVTEYTFNDTDLPAGEFYFMSEEPSAFLLFTREFPASGEIDVTPSSSLYKDLSLDQICRLGNGTVGDGSDTDCDGLADEENVCYIGYGTTKQDSDLDGAFGEDCETSQEGTATVPAPVEPECYTNIPEQTDSSCWQNCACKCSWQNNLETYQKMNKSEQDAYNQAESEKYQKDMEVDEESLSSTVAEKQSAEDKRTSSKSIGFAGVMFIALVVCVVVIFDVISVIQKIREKRNAVENVQ